MTGTLGNLVLAALAFVGSHILLSWPPVRGRLVSALGDWPFRILYSVVAVATLTWMILAYAEAPHLEVWSPPVALKHLPVTLMLPACILLVGGYTIANPTAVILDNLAESRPLPGIAKVTRHPVMWAVALWGIAHLLSKGDAAAWVFFGSLTFLALGGAAMSDLRRRTEGGPLWDRLQAETSFLPFAALLQKRSRTSLKEIGWFRLLGGIVLYAVFFHVHEAVIGLSPLPIN